MSTEFSHAIHDASEAAADTAHAAGVEEATCLRIYEAAVLAAASAIDANDGLAAALAGTGREPNGAPAPPMVRRREYSNEASRIEATLTRAIKRNAVRVVDLFTDWDEDRNGLISRKEFRQALLSTGIDASLEDIDALFSKWDQDKCVPP